MVVELKYGRSKLVLDTGPEPRTTLVTGGEAAPMKDLKEAVRAGLRDPMAKPRLSKEVKAKGAKNAVIIVNDLTRPTPYHDMLGPILDELSMGGIADEHITLIVATGIHRGMTEDEFRLAYGDEAVSRVRVLNHDCDNSEVIYVGTLSSGTELYVNKLVVDSDFVIATGVIGPHYFAGFSGGRKSVLPGVAARASITHNHELMNHERSFVCNLDGNPVHIEMAQAAKLVSVDFMVNIVVDGAGHSVGVVAGDLEKAWEKGVRIGSELLMVPIDSEVDVAFASAGGFPKDINMYQSQKAIDNAARAVRPGGTIVLVAECPEGHGEPVFEQWMKEAGSVQDILDRFSRGFELGGHKAYALARVLIDREVILISSLGEGFARELFMTHAESLDEALSLVQNKHGRDYTAVIMPTAGIVVPMVR